MCYWRSYGGGHIEALSLLTEGQHHEHHQQQQQLQQQQQHQAQTSSSSCVDVASAADLSVPPPWQGRSVAGPKLRLVNMSAFVDFTVPAADMFSPNTVRVEYTGAILAVGEPGAEGRDTTPQSEVSPLKATKFRLS